MESKPHERDDEFDGICLNPEHGRLVEQLEALREEVRRFADEFPGDSHDWRWVQKWAKDALAPSKPESP